MTQPTLEKLPNIAHLQQRVMRRLLVLEIHKLAKKAWPHLAHWSARTLIDDGVRSFEEFMVDNDVVFGTWTALDEGPITLTQDEFERLFDLLNALIDVWEFGWGDDTMHVNFTNPGHQFSKVLAHEVQSLRYFLDTFAAQAR